MALSPWLFRLAALPYDWMTAHPIWREHCRKMAEHLPPGGRRTVVDLGCGPGVSTLALADALPTDRLIGLDTSQAMLRRAMGHDPQGRCAWLRADVHDLPFRDGSVDALTAHSFLYLLAQRGRALDEMRRVLVPGGSLILMEPSRQTSADALASVVQSLEAGGPHLAFTMGCWRIAARSSGAFDAEDLAGLLERHGFGSVEIEPTLHGMGWLTEARAPARTEVVTFSAAG